MKGSFDDTNAACWMDFPKLNNVNVMKEVIVEEIKCVKLHGTAIGTNDIKSNSRSLTIAADAMNLTFSQGAIGKFISMVVGLHNGFKDKELLSNNCSCDNGIIFQSSI